MWYMRLVSRSSRSASTRRWARLGTVTGAAAPRSLVDATGRAALGVAALVEGAALEGAALVAAASAGITATSGIGNLRRPPLRRSAGGGAVLPAGGEGL